MSMQAGATIADVTCPDCRKAVPVECQDVTGMSLDDMIAEALAGVTRQHPDHHGTVSVGREDADDHHILVGAHYHDEDTYAGLEVACSCGSLLFTDCDPDGFAVLTLDEIRDIAAGHAGRA